MSGISCHVLDTSLGRPAEGLGIVLERWLEEPDEWVRVSQAATNADGRALGLAGSEPLIPGPHRITFATGPYFIGKRQPVFYPEVRVTFVVSAAGENYHIPLLLSPFGYSTYRGS
jgi:5-hydroxyisourate hydrolase